MKLSEQNRSHKVLIITTIVINCILLISFTYFFFTSRNIPEFKVVLSVEKTSTGAPYGNNISDQSLMELQKRLDSFSGKFSGDSLVQTFTRERDGFVFILNMVAIILAIFSAYFIITRLVEKDEYERVRVQLQEKTTEIDDILVTLKCSGFETKLTSDMAQLRIEDFKFFDEKGFLQDSPERFDTYFFIEITKLVDTLLEFPLDLIIERKTILMVVNYFYNLTHYAQRTNCMTSEEFHSNKNRLAKTFARLIRSRLNPKIVDIMLSHLAMTYGTPKMEL